MKRAILVVSFGSSYEETLKKNIEKTEEAISVRFSNHEVRRAFTSSMIIRKLRGRGIDIESPQEAIERLVSDGYEEILVQPLHIIPGFEYEKIKLAVTMARHRYKETKIILSTPLLYREEDYIEVIKVLNDDIGDKKENHGFLFMGHGTEHPSNAVYSQLQNMFSDKRSDVFIANVEGYPELEHVIPRLKGRFKSMTLIPLMMVAGDHAINDMASDDEDSFKSRLLSNDISVECELKGLGERNGIRELFIKKLNEII